MRNLTAACALSFAAAMFVPSQVLALDLVKDGKAAATIVLPNQPNETEQKAAQVLVKYLKMCSGAELEVLPESSPRLRVPASPRLTVISVGRTEMANAAGLSAKDLKYDGYRLQVRGGALYLLGRDTPRTPKMEDYQGAQGTWRAALGLLERLGFRWIEPTDKGVYVPELKTVSVPDDLNVTFNPPFMYAIGRMSGLGDWSMANNFRCSVNLYSEGGHTWHTFVPAKLWDTHPEYFQMRDGKRVKPVGDGYFVCPSNPDVQKLLADGLRKKFDEGYDMVQLGQSDGYRPCQCDACKALDQPGEIQEQVHVPHYNVMKMVYETHPDKLVHMLIYPPTNTPSRKITQYPPNAMSEVCLAGGTAQAFVGEDNFTDEKQTQGYEEALKFWSSKMPAGLTVYVYYMGTYHSIGLAPKFTPRRAAEAIRMLHKYNVKGIYFCGGGENWGAEGPTYYVIGRLMNDPSQEWSPLVDEYCQDTFGKAAATMREYYDLLYARIEGAGLWSVPIMSDAAELFPAMYPPAVLDQLDSLLAKARQEAAGDPRATGWLRLAGLSYRHIALITRTYALYNAYMADPTAQNFDQTLAAARRYGAFADEILALEKTDAAFVRDYFPYWAFGWNGYQCVRTNGGMGASRNLKAPFTWAGKPGVRLEENYAAEPGKAQKPAAWSSSDRLRVERAPDGLVFTCPPKEEAPDAFACTGGPSGALIDMPLVVELRMKCAFVKDGHAEIYYCLPPDYWRIEWRTDRTDDGINPRAFIPVDTAAWHTYRIVARSPTDVRLLVDGVSHPGISLAKSSTSAAYFQFRVYGPGGQATISRMMLSGMELK